MPIRGISWGGSLFVPASVGDLLAPPNIAAARQAFRRIRAIGANVVRVEVSSAANTDEHRRALKQLQQLAASNGLVLLVANVPLDDRDQSAWLTTLVGWFTQRDNVWYLPETDPGCGSRVTGSSCGDTEAWIWSQQQNIRLLRNAGVRTPIVINLPGGSRSVSVNWTQALGDRNLIYGVHPGAEGRQQFGARDANRLSVSLSEAARGAPVIFDMVGRMEVRTELKRLPYDSGISRETQLRRTSTDTLRWSAGLLDWITAWTVADGGDGAIVTGWDTPTRNALSAGPRKLTRWGKTAARGYFAISFRAQSGRDPGSGFPGGFAFGDRGPGVRKLQDLLQRNGYLAARSATGSYNPATWQAVTAFQGWSRLNRDGTAGASTVARLLNTTRPQPRFSGKAHIEIDITRQVLHLVNASGRVVRTTHISSGATGNTPVGMYSVLRKERLSWSVPFKAWLPYALYFYEGFAMHEYPDVPAFPASHGCVRLSAGEAVTVYAFSSVGMPVMVY